MVGAPSYTSGTHMWKGTLATLKPKPTSSIAAPSTARADVSDEATATARSTLSRAVLPLTP